MTWRLGTRGSALAKAQSTLVARAVEGVTGTPVELVILSTRGDRVTDRPLAEVGGKGLFTLELEAALQDGSIDFAVHSMKDLPTDETPGLVIGAVPEREDPRDAVVGASLAELAPGAVVGTGSARRQCQLLALRPDLTVAGIRGNVDTRIRKQREGDYDAVLLAMAGLLRLGLASVVSEAVGCGDMIPAPGQGALAVQCRQDRSEVLAALAAIHHQPTATCVAAERAFLHELSGGCSVPAGCHGTWVGDLLRVRAVLGTAGGLRHHETRGEGNDAEALGRAAARAVSGV